MGFKYNYISIKVYIPTSKFTVVTTNCLLSHTAQRNTSQTAVFLFPLPLANFPPSIFKSHARPPDRVSNTGLNETERLPLCH